MITFNNNFEKWIRNECVCLRGFRIGKNSFLQSLYLYFICTKFVFLNVFLQFLWQNLFLVFFSKTFASLSVCLSHPFDNATLICISRLATQRHYIDDVEFVAIIIEITSEFACLKNDFLCAKEAFQKVASFGKKKKKEFGKNLQKFADIKKIDSRKSALQTQCCFRYRRRKMN